MEHCPKLFSFSEAGFVASEFPAGDLLIFGKPSSHIVLVDHGERKGGGKLLYRLLLSLGGNP